MKKSLESMIFIFIGIFLFSCGNTTSMSPIVATATSYRNPLPTNITSTIPQATTTPTFDPRTFILTPDDLFSLPELEILNTPDSNDFCEHLPPPRLITNSDRLSILSGRFMLCSHESWPWVTNTAIDLDTGSFVSKYDENADIVMENTPWGDEPYFALVGRSKVYISNALLLEKYPKNSGVNRLSYGYCEDILRDETDPSVFIVTEGEIACVKTSEGKIALIRVEKIYFPNFLSVEFSFTVLR